MMSYVAGPGLNGAGSEGLWELKCVVTKPEKIIQIKNKLQYIAVKHI